MRVAVTGGTGFVGSHTAAALIAAGHGVRMVVRDSTRVAAALEPHGIGPGQVEVATADVSDRTAVTEALTGADAVVHAASVYSFDPRRAREIAAVNEAGVRHVLETAAQQGLDPIVHVSSTLALYRDDVVGATITADSPPGSSPHPYSGAKARQEAFARRLQAMGAPVVITHPGGVWGPHDPYDGESVRLARSAVGGRLTFLPDLSGAFVDVRDVAAVHAAVMEPGRGPRRYLAAGHVVSVARLVELITAAYGRPRRTIRVPLGVGKAVAALGGQLRTRFGLDLGADPEVVWAGSRRVRADDRATTAELGVEFRPLGVSVSDQVQWMKATGRF